MPKTGRLLIKSLAKSKGFKAKDIAKHCGVSLTTVKMWYNHTRRPSLDHLIILSELLQCSIEDFFEDISDPEITNDG